MTSQLDSSAVAEYLIDNAHFFDEHAELLSKIKLTSPLVGRAVSLQERQMEVLREKIKAIELRMAELLRIAEDNQALSEKVQAWTRSLLLARNDVDLPHALTDGLQTIFGVPFATLRIWGVAAEFSHTWFASEISEDARLFSSSLTVPFCGRNNDFEAVSWLEEAPTIQSVVMISLRKEGGTNAFGLLILGSPDPERFTADMATDFVTKIGETASAALTCLLD